LLAVSGDSAGGNLAAVVSILARDAGGPPIALQLLAYPTTDSGTTYPSHVENADGPFLTQESMEWFYDHYKPVHDDPRVSPLRASDLSGLPPAHIITAQFDPLRDEGEAYGEALRDAGVTVVAHRYETMPHMFLQLWGVLPAAKEAMTEMAEALRKAFAS
jgi:acetyl esterase